MDRFDKFTDRARKVLTLAQDEAQRFNHNYIGTEHLLLGLVREGEGVAARVLENMNVELAKVRTAVEFIIGRGDRPVVGEVGLTPRAKRVIELAIDEARRLGHNYIGTEHLLLGLVREGEGIAAGVLESLGVNLDKVRHEVIRVLSQSSSAGPAEEANKVRADLEGVHAMNDADYDALTRRATEADDAVKVEERCGLEFQMQLASLNTQHRQAVDLYVQLEKQRTQFVEEIGTIRDQVKSLEFNNALVKRIRAARPIIANKLWAMVLASVSQIFSLMRGETSIVTKGEDGFEVNGHSATSLSGSAKDLLGLAVRAALVKTFIPACPFIVLDEPAAACDDDRSNMLLGYVAASRFQQTLLVTHDSVSETFANIVIRF